ncbi:11835_t:CDS:2, partial [Scutellospora calospora]
VACLRLCPSQLSIQVKQIEFTSETKGKGQLENANLEIDYNITKLRLENFLMKIVITKAWTKLN